MLNKYFQGNIYVINLDRRPDRMKLFSDQAKYFGFNFLRTPAVDSINIPYSNPHNLKHFSPGDIACALSHGKIVSECYLHNIPYYLVFEDDALLDKDFNFIFENFWKGVPQNWDMIYLGGNHLNAEKVYIDSNIMKVKGSLTTHAMVIKNTMYYDLIQLWSNPEKHVDTLLTELHSKYNCYAFSPSIVTQRSGYSDILNRDTDYTNYIK